MMPSLDMLLAVFEFEFMRNALLISVLVAIPTAMLSASWSSRAGR